jgi:hypothetical protein
MFGIKRLVLRSTYAYERLHGIHKHTRLWLTNRSDILNLARPGGVGIELGVAEADLSSELLSRGVLKKLYGVDQYRGDRGHDAGQYARALDKTARFGSAYALMKMTFDEALNEFPDEFFDFVYIDGYAHTGQEGGHTIRTWYNKVRSGGVISGDDFSSHFPLVVKEVQAFADDEGLALSILPFKRRTNWASHHPSWLCVKP